MMNYGFLDYFEVRLMSFRKNLEIFQWGVSNGGIEVRFGVFFIILIRNCNMVPFLGFVPVVGKLFLSWST
jgi:hypothetical protein